MVLNQIMQGERHFKHVLVDKVKGTTHPLPKLMHCRAKVTRAIQFFFQPAVVELVCISSQLFYEEIFAFSYTCNCQVTAFLYTGLDCFKYRFTAEHA